VRLPLCAAVAHAASVLLADAAIKQQQQQHASEGATAAAAAAEPEELACSSSDAAVMLPSVVILGRCCMVWAEQLRAHPTLPQQQPVDPCSSQEQQRQQHWRGLNEARGLNIIGILSVVQQWLQAGSTCAQLVAAGYAPRAVLEQLQEVSAAWQALQDRPPDTAGALVAAQLLQSTGLALCSFAVPCMCNNPGCTSMAGLTELASVSGRSCICGGCRVARYCGRACQRAAWKQHKPVCGALSVAAGCGTWRGS
jgi:hypothetical protein